jgi:hypothetical protein
MMISNILKSICLASVVAILAACGGSSGGDGSSVEVDNDPALGSNPNVRVATENFGVDGNLWKPSGDDHGSSPGAVVVIIGPRYQKQFDSCEVKLRDGTTKQLTCVNNVPWTHTPYSCFANPSNGGERQHWRSFTSCHDMAEVKATCYLDGQEFVFQAPEGQVGSVCTRFG